MRKAFLLLLLFSSLIPLMAQNQAVYGIVLNRNGQPIPGASIAVCTQPANTVTAPCTPLANLCSSLTDNTCTSPNPVIADGLGNYMFYAPILATGGYTYQFYGSGLTMRSELDHGPSNSGVGVTVPGSNTQAIFNVGGVFGTYAGIFNDPVGGFFHLPGGMQSDAAGGFRMNANILSVIMPTSGSISTSEIGVCPAGTNIRQGEWCVSEANGAVVGLATRGQLIGTDFSLDANGCTLFTANGNVNWCFSFNTGVFGFHNGLTGVLGKYFGTFTSPTVNESIDIGWSPSNSVYFIGSNHGSGGGSYRQVCLGTSGPTTLNGWCVKPDGSLQASASNPNPSITGVFNIVLNRVGLVGTAPTCSPTSGAGASATCTLQTGSTDGGGTILLAPAGAGIAGTGTITLTFNAAFGADTPPCLYMASDLGATWAALAVMKDKTPSPASDLFTWTNGTVPTILSTPATYDINYWCPGK